MLLTRRQFFAMPAAAALVSALPRGILAAPPEPAISIDLVEKAIKVREPMAFKVLHGLIRDRFDDSDLITETMPMLRLTDNLFQFEEDWHFADQQSRENMYAASWQEGDDTWARNIGWGVLDPQNPNTDHPIGAWMDFSNIPEGLLIHAG